MPTCRLVTHLGSPRYWHYSDVCAVGPSNNRNASIKLTLALSLCRACCKHQLQLIPWKVLKVHIVVITIFKMRIPGHSKGVHLLKITFTELETRAKGAPTDLWQRFFTLGNLDDRFLLSWAIGAGRDLSSHLFPIFYFIEGTTENQRYRAIGQRKENQWMPVVSALASWPQPSIHEIELGSGRGRWKGCSWPQDSFFRGNCFILVPKRSLRHGFWSSLMTHAHICNVIVCNVIDFFIQYKLTQEHAGQPPGR